MKSALVLSQHASHLCADTLYRFPDSAENSPQLLMQVSLMLDDPEQEATLVKNASDYHYPWRRALEGKLVSSGHNVRDLNGERACFFIFPDLSVRLEGSYRLCFTLVRLGPNTMCVVSQSWTELCIYSTFSLAEVLREGSWLPLRRSHSRSIA